MKRIGLLLLAALLLLTGCASGEQSAPSSAPPAAQDAAYEQIDQETAKRMMAEDDGSVVVDVRRFDEFREGHIPGAICLPNETIGAEPPEELPNPAQTILIYCRSGNRSKQAAEKLAALGYTGLYEFGGIIDWTGEVVTGQSLLLRVEANPTTGYRWTVAQEQELFAVREGYTARPQTQPISGAGGWQSFLFTPQQAGTAQLRFTYSRSWEPREDDPQFTCTVEIAEDLTLTVTEAPSEQNYRPTVRIYG